MSNCLVGAEGAYDYLRDNEGLHTVEDLVRAGMSRCQASNALRRVAKYDDIIVERVERRGKPCHAYKHASWSVPSGGRLTR